MESLFKVEGEADSVSSRAQALGIDESRQSHAKTCSRQQQMPSA